MLSVIHGPCVKLRPSSLVTYASTPLSSTAIHGEHGDPAECLAPSSRGRCPGKGLLDLLQAFVKRAYHPRQQGQPATRRLPPPAWLRAEFEKDFFYVCLGHLKDRGFCEPDADEAAAIADKQKKEAMDKEVQKIKEEYDEKQRRKKERRKEKEKEKGKDKEKDKEDKKDEDSEDKKDETERDEKVSSLTCTPTTPKLM